MYSDIFHGNELSYIVFRQAQNIASALSLLSSNVVGNDILKKALFEGALSCIHSASELVEIRALHGEEKLRKLLGVVFELQSLSNAGFWTGDISDMNNNLVQQEMKHLEKNLYDLIVSQSSKFIVSTSLFKDTHDLEGDFMYIRKDIKYKGQDKGQYTVKDNINMSNTNVPPKVNAVREDRSERRGTLLKVLGELGPVSIKDIAEKLPSIGEKTIQRELAALIAQGVIKKEGNGAGVSTLYHCKVT